MKEKLPKHFREKESGIGNFEGAIMRQCRGGLRWVPSASRLFVFTYFQRGRSRAWQRACASSTSGTGNGGDRMRSAPGVVHL